MLVHKLSKSSREKCRSANTALQYLVHISYGVCQCWPAVVHVSNKQMQAAARHCMHEVHTLHIFQSQQSSVSVASAGLYGHQPAHSFNIKNLILIIITKTTTTTTTNQINHLDTYRRTHLLRRHFNCQ